MKSCLPLKASWWALEMFIEACLTFVLFQIWFTRVLFTDFLLNRNMNRCEIGLNLEFDAGSKRRAKVWTQDIDFCFYSAGDQWRDLLVKQNWTTMDVCDICAGASSAVSLLAVKLPIKQIYAWSMEMPSENGLWVLFCFRLPPVHNLWYCRDSGECMNASFSIHLYRSRGFRCCS